MFGCFSLLKVCFFGNLLALGWMGDVKCVVRYQGTLYGSKQPIFNVEMGI